MRSSWLDYVRQRGLAQAAATQTPQYISRPDLRIRGVEGNPAQQTRQYMAPIPAQASPPPTGVTGGTFTPEQVVDQAMNSTAATFMDPAERDNFLANIYAQAIAPPPPPAAPPPYPTEFAPRPEVVPNINPFGIDPQLWNEMSPEERAQQIEAAQQIEQQGYTDAPLVEDPAVVSANQQALANQEPITLDEFLNAGWKRNFLSPLVQEGVDVGTQLVEGASRVPGVPQDVIEAGQQIQKGMAIPEEKWYEMQMDAAIQYSRTGDMPTWADIYYTDIPGQKYIPDWAPGNASAADIWSLPNYLEAHPEARATVARIADEAEANGQDPRAAVSAWWTEQQGLLINMGSRAVNDPLNAAGFGGWGATRIRTGLRALEEAGAVEKGSTTAKVLEGAATAADLPNVIVNEPWRIGNTLRTPFGGRFTESAVGQALTGPSEQQVVRDARAAAGQTEADLVRTAEQMQRNPDIRFQNLDEGVAPAAEDVVVNNTVAPKITSAESAPPNPDVGPRPVTETDVAKQTQPGSRLPDVAPQRAPTDDPGWSLRPKKENVGTAKERMIDSAAEAYPEQTARVLAEDSEFSTWARERYERNYNELGDASKRGEVSDFPGASNVSGMNKANRKVLEGEYMVRLRTALEAEGVPVENLPWMKDSRLGGMVVDEGLVAQGYDEVRTFKHSTLEAAMERYLYGPELTPKQMEVMQDRGIFFTDKQLEELAKTGKLPSDVQRKAFERYQYATAIRNALQNPDTIRRQVEEIVGEPIRKAVSEADLSALPSPDEIRARGNAWVADAQDAVMAAPESAQAAIMNELADAAREIYPSRTYVSPKQEMFADLRFGAKLREVAGRHGVDIPAPQAVAGARRGSIVRAETAADDIVADLRAAILDPNPESAAARLRELEQRGNIRSISPNGYAEIDPARHAAEIRGWENFQEVTDLRDRIHNAVPQPRTSVTPQIRRLTSRRGHTTGWEVTIGDDMRWEFKTKGEAEAFAREATTEGIRPWRAEQVKGSANNAYVAINEITGERRYFYPEGPAKSGKSGRDAARAFMAAKDAAGENEPMSIAEALDAIERHQQVEDAAVAGRSFGSPEPGPADSRIPEYPNREPAPATETVADPARRANDQKAAELFESAVGRARKTDGDVAVSSLLREGMIDQQQARAFATEYAFKAAKNGDPPTVMTMYDRFFERLAEHDGDILKANRATASDMAKVNREFRSELVEDVVKAQGLERGEINKLLKINQEYMRLIREGTLLSPFRVVPGGLLDGIGNGLFQMMRGHHSSAFHALNPRNMAAWTMHTWKGRAVETAPFDLARALGTAMPNSVVEVATRDLYEVLDETAWANLLGRFAGKPGKVASRVIAPRIGRAFRHAIDQAARSGLWADQVYRQLRTERYEFITRLRRENPGGVGNQIADELLGTRQSSPGFFKPIGRAENNVAFSPEDVRNAFARHGVTGQSGPWVRDWREAVRRMSDAGVEEVNRIHFDFRMTKADEIARHTLMFHYWQSRAMLYYAKETLGNPYLLNLNMKMWKVLDEEADRQDAGNPMNLFFKYMAGDGGVYALVDPIGALLPYSMFRDLTSQTYGNETWYDKWVARWGFMVNPIIGGAAAAIGATNRIPDMTGTLGTRNAILSIMDWARNHGHDFGKGPGITGDPITNIQNRLVDVINEGVRWFTKDDTDPIRPAKSQANKQQQAINIMIAQAEAEAGVTYQEMLANPDKYGAMLDSITEAQIAIMTGNYDQSERAQDAVAQMSEDTVIGTGVRATVPGYTQIRNEDVDTYRANLDSGMEKVTSGNRENLTQDEQSALAQNQQQNAGSPEAAKLISKNAQYQNLGTDDQQYLNQGWGTVAFSTDIPANSITEIGGQTYYGFELMKMTPEQRMKLADAWVLEELSYMTGETPDAENNAFTQYRDEREAFAAGSPEMQDYQAYQKRAREYDGGEKIVNTGKAEIDPYGNVVAGTRLEGGMRAFRGYLEMTDPNFARAIQQQRSTLQDRGLSGEDLERSLDAWARSPEGYNAARGIKHDRRDPTPLPTYQTGSAGTLPPPSASEQAAATEESAKDSGGGSSSGWNAERNMPQWQADLVDEYGSYEQLVAQFEAKYGPIENYQSSMGQKAIAKFFRDAGFDMSRDLQSYFRWSDKEIAAGRDGSLDSYFAEKDRLYEEKKAKAEAK